ncbi:MOSC domain-containing protein [Brachybacterium aquaticum]|uniref:MOSC domain-containing protein YiiM n=1 Tax=Brachybacterium aquaticum TaxID=1432564 RepID=A0A841ADG1_9MICO|nr:MOSC domain-containing protein [Brachybacterium aquaticum]MBB5831290.1 MOSC domain-containing protein YiiM [Brachybacterium aquaticum]
MTTSALPADALPAGARGRVGAVCVVATLHADDGSVGTTAIDKRAVEGPVAVGPLGLYADVQADRAHHGGADQAVYAVDAEERAHWSRELGRALAPGALGENLSIEDLPIDDLEIGARVRLGTALLEVTAPRTPCMTFQRWMGTDDFRARYHERGRTGVYFRVLETGQVEAGDALEVVDAPGHGATVAAVYGGARDRDLTRRLATWADGAGVALHRELEARAQRHLKGERHSKDER